MPTSKTATAKPEAEKAPATPNREAHKNKNLVTKLSEITGRIARLEKKGQNKAQHYSFVRESDLAAEASALFAEYGIFVTQSVVKSTMKPLFTTSSGNQMWLTRVRMEFHIFDADSEMRIGPLYFNGAGADTGDKGIYKAMTGAEKYFLMKTFLVATGDDPEADESVDKAAAGSGAKKGAKVSGKASTTAKRGGKTEGITGAQMKVIGELIRAKGISAPGYLAVVAMTVDVPEGSDANVITRGLSAEQAGQVIQALEGLDESSKEAADPGKQSADGDPEGAGDPVPEDDEQGGMTVV